jgi:hypothetical protein
MAQDVRIIGGEFTQAQLGGLPSGVMGAAERALRSPGACPICGTPDGACKGDTEVHLVNDVDPMVRLLVTCEGVRDDGTDRPYTFLIGLAGQEVRRSSAVLGPPGCYEEIAPVDSARP